MRGMFSWNPCVEKLSRISEGCANLEGKHRLPP